MGSKNVLRLHAFCAPHTALKLKDDLVRVPHTWYLSGQSFITLLKLVWNELDKVVMNNWKKKCVGLQRAGVCKRLLHVWQKPLAVYVYPKTCIIIWDFRLKSGCLTNWVTSSWKTFKNYKFIYKFILTAGQRLSEDKEGHFIVVTNDHQTLKLRSTEMTT